MWWSSSEIQRLHNSLCGSDLGGGDDWAADRLVMAAEVDRVDFSGIPVQVPVFMDCSPGSWCAAILVCLHGLVGLFRLPWALVQLQREEPQVVSSGTCIFGFGGVGGDSGGGCLAGDDVAGDGVGIVNGTLNRELSSVTEKDLEHLLHLLDGKDGEMAWQSMMERSTSNLTYQAWRHEPEVGPICIAAKHFLRMPLLSWSEIFSGMMSFGQNGILCLYKSKYWKNAMIRE